MLCFLTLYLSRLYGVIQHICTSQPNYRMDCCIPFIRYVLKRVSFGSKDCTKELKLECAYSWARLASFCHLGFISDPLIVSKFHNETQDPKGQENKIYTIVKGRETFYQMTRK